MKTHVRRFMPCLIVFAVLLFLPPHPARAEERTAAEYEVKAAFVYNFAKFIDWPAESFANETAPFTICILGNNPFGKGFDPIRPKTVKNRPVAIREIAAVASAGGCQVLFISPAVEDRTEKILLSLKDSPVLVVGDMDRFAGRGGMIGFIVERNKVTFEINDAAAKRAGLRISSQLLKLARTVY